MESAYGKFLFKTTFGKEAPETVISLILDFVLQLMQDHVSHPHQEESSKRIPTSSSLNPPQHSYLELCNVKFPKSSGININMMPFHYEDKDSIPKKYHNYWHMIEACKKYSSTNNAKNEVWYLTIHESDVDMNSTQRRPGLHIDRPGGLEIGGGDWFTVYWGDGEATARRYGGMKGGIFMANSERHSCAVWDTYIEHPSQCVWKHGDLEHLRERCFSKGNKIKLHEDTLYWITDSTPHESLPLPKKTRRQFFRLVTGKVTVWFQDHSTENPLGVQPDAIILCGNKFYEKIKIKQGKKKKKEDKKKTKKQEQMRDELVSGIKNKEFWGPASLI